MIFKSRFRLLYIINILKNSIIVIINFIEIYKLVFNSITTKPLNMSIAVKYKFIACNVNINNSVSLIKVN